MSTQHIYHRLRSDLQQALKSRDKRKAESLKIIISLIDNASAIPTTETNSTALNSSIAGATAGTGSTEMPRKELTDADIRHILQQEINELDEVRKSLNDSTGAAYNQDLKYKINLLNLYIHDSPAQ